MGSTFSRADTAPPPNPFAMPATAAAAVSQSKSIENAKEVNYLDLPQPIRYEELTREACMALKPELFEGLRFDLTKPLNHNFAVAHGIFLGNFEVPTNNSQQVLKMPHGTYEFGANLASNKGNLIIGRIATDGRLSGTIKYDLTDWLSVKTQLQMANERGMSQCIADLNFKGSDWNGQFKLGSSQFYGINYFQSATPNLSVGGEAFWFGNQMRSGVGLAARHATEQHIATAQVATTGLISLTYVQKVNEKASLGTEFTYNWNSREANACFGYDYILRQCRLRGRVDTDGKVSAYLEERVNMGVNFVLSAELDHFRKDYKFGFGMIVGE